MNISYLMYKKMMHLNLLKSNFIFSRSNFEIFVLCFVFSFTSGIQTDNVHRDVCVFQQTTFLLHNNNNNKKQKKNNIKAETIKVEHQKKNLRGFLFVVVVYCTFIFIFNLKICFYEIANSIGIHFSFLLPFFLFFLIENLRLIISK